MNVTVDDMEDEAFGPSVNVSQYARLEVGGNYFRIQNPLDDVVPRKVSYWMNNAQVSRARFSQALAESQ